MRKREPRGAITLACIGILLSSILCLLPLPGQASLGMPASGEEWTEPVRINEPGVENPPGCYGGSLAVDSKGKVHVAYKTYHGYEVHYVTNKSGSWSDIKVSGTDDNNGEPSIAVDGNDKVYIAYDSNGFIRYVTNASGSWSGPATASENGGRPRLAMDGNNKMHIAIELYGGTEQQLAYMTNASGAWTAPVIISGSANGCYPSDIAIDSQNKAHVIYNDDASIHYVTNKSGSWSSPTTVINPSDAGHQVWDFDMLLDPADKMHIVYCVYLGIYRGRYITNESGSWSAPVTIGGTDSPGSVSIAQDPAGKLHSIYYLRDYPNTNRYIRKTTTGWTNPIDIQGAGNGDLCFDVDNADKPHVIYGDGAVYYVTEKVPPVSTFYFAEGYTGLGFQEYLCLGNPQNTKANATITYMYPDGSTDEQEVQVPANSRVTVDVNTQAGTGMSVSAKVEADQSIVAERPMYFNYGGWDGGHDTVGASAPATTFYFAEGYTGPGFEEYICVMNPGDKDADLTFRFQTQEVGEKVVGGKSVSAQSRDTFLVNDLLGGGTYSTSLKLESSQPVVAERPMYFDYSGMGGHAWNGGHCVMGATSLAKRYYFAEGYTGSGFEEWLCLQNPGTSDISIHATYMLGTGKTVEVDHPVPAGKRANVYVPYQVGEGQDVSVMLTCASLFLAERPMYFAYGGSWMGGHCVIGATESAENWFFAEGYTGGGFDEWLCIQNPGDTPADVTITYYPEGGGDPIVRPQPPIKANSRFTVYVNSEENAGPGLSISAKVTSNTPIIVERPMYFDFAGRTGGHDVVGFIP
jgi:hypothetical protein